MRFKIDENLPIYLAELLSGAGHSATTVYDESLGGAPDQQLIQVCRDEQRVLITLDLDFADIRTYPPAAYAGLIVLRLASQDKSSVLAVFDRLLPSLDEQPLQGQLWIVSEGRIRIRQ